MSTNYVKLMNNLETLGLDKMREYMDTYIDLVNSGEKTVTDALFELTEHEKSLRT